MSSAQREDGVTVTNNTEQHRYEVHLDGELAGFSQYQPATGLIVFTHTEIDPRFEGRGLGSVLVRHALDDVRTTGDAVLPTCPFVQSYMQRHPEYADLDYRSRPPSGRP